MKNGRSNFGFSYTYIKFGKFWSVSLGHFIKHKFLISEEYARVHSRYETANYEFNLKWAEITTMGSAHLVGAIASEMLEFSKTI